MSSQKTLQMQSYIYNTDAVLTHVQPTHTSEYVCAQIEDSLLSKIGDNGDCEANDG